MRGIAGPSRPAVDAARPTPPRRYQAGSSGREMLTDSVSGLLDGRLCGGHVADGVQQHEIMDRAVVADRIDIDAGLLELAGVGLTLVAQRVVLRSDDERGRQSLELFGGR